MWFEILQDGFLAAVAAMGFGAVSVPPRRAFAPIMILAAVGHAFRFVLMNYLGVDIAGASLLASVLIGLLSYCFGRWWVHCPMTVMYIPALLPMVPGMYAYRSVLSFVQFIVHHKDEVLGPKLMMECLTNSAITVMVVFVLGVGSILPVMLLHRSSYTLSRYNRMSYLDKKR